MKFIREIARGGFGVVQEVSVDGKSHALKLFDPQNAAKGTERYETFLKRFKREVRTQSAFASQFIIPIVKFDLECAQPWFLMPLAERDLLTEIQQSRKSGEIPVKALADVLNALEELHNLDYVHRDLKPQNVLLHEGVWKLSDLGLVLPPEGKTTVLTQKTAWGTQEYAAPEQAMDFHSVKKFADIYSYGCILHDIFGREDRVPFSQHSAPGPVGWVIERCTHKDPEKRFKSIKSLRESLLSVLADSASSVSLSSETSEWEAQLKQFKEWDVQKLNDLARYIEKAESDQRYAILQSIDEEQIQHFFSIDYTSWRRVALIYCEWARDSGFQFEFCDVVIGRLEKIYELGQLTEKSEALIAAAVLAKDHNRFFVMQRVLYLCGNTMSDELAKRLVIDIRASETEYDFIICASALRRDISAYHPRIYALLKEE